MVEFLQQPEIQAVLLTALLGVIAWGFLEWRKARKRATLRRNTLNENLPPLTTTPAGVKIKDAEVGRDIHAYSSGAGGVEIENAKAKGTIEGTHSPGSPPKP